MAFFVGGQLLVAVAVVPVLRGAQAEHLRAVARRFGWGTLAAIGVLLVTGTAQATHDAHWSDPILHVKLALAAVVAGLLVWHLLRPALHALQGAIFLTSLAIVWLGTLLAHHGHG